MLRVFISCLTANCNDEDGDDMTTTTVTMSFVRPTHCA